MVRLLSLFAPLIFLSSNASADVLFEGYSKILSGGVHVGYIVMKNEYDPKTKTFVMTHFLKTGSLGADVTESLRAVADAEFNPVSYEYTSVVGKKTKTIDAKFKKGKMTATVVDDGKKKTVSLDVPKGAFLSRFLTYLMLKSDKGLRVGEKFAYTAIAEEDAGAVKGEAFVSKEEDHLGVRAFKILSKFKDSKDVFYVSERGEYLSTSTPAMSIGTELAAKPADALGNFGASGAILKKLFGEVPQGTENILSKKAMQDALKPSAPAGAGKTHGVPSGEGVMIKSEGGRK